MRNSSGQTTHYTTGIIAILLRTLVRSSFVPSIPVVYIVLLDARGCSSTHICVLSQAPGKHKVGFVWIGDQRNPYPPTRKIQMLKGEK